MFSNPIATKTTERRWTPWVIAGVLHVVVLYFLLSGFGRSEPETYEVFSEPILLEDKEPAFVPMKAPDPAIPEPAPVTRPATTRTR